VTGIVRRAHPSASDQRFAIAPRSRKDIRLGRLIEGADDGDDDDEEGDDDGAGAWAGSDDGDGSFGIAAVTFASLAELDDEVVRVGGRVDGAAGRRLSVDDGTAMGVVRLPQTGVALEPSAWVGQVVNATGRVERRDGGHREVVVRSASDVRRAAALTVAPREEGSTPGAGQQAMPDLPIPVPRGEAAESPGGDLGLLLLAASLGLALGLVVLSVAAAGVAWYLRRRPARSPAPCSAPSVRSAG
jgi:hypothetical protein